MVVKVVKIAFQNKGIKTNKTKKAPIIKGNLFIKYVIKNKRLIVIGGQIILHQGTEFNEHQKPSFDKNPPLLRQKFSEKFKIQINNLNRKVHKMNSKQIKWWNDNFNISGKSILSISDCLLGYGTAGSEAVKWKSPFKMIDGLHKGKEFINLIRSFTRKGLLKTADFNYSNYETFDQFLEKASKVSNKYKYIIDNFYNDQFEYFYVDEMLEFLGHKNKFNKSRNKFRNNLISKYGRIDQFYKIFKSRKMVEACHIIPVKFAESNQIEDLNNGLLLSPDIHKLFDAGVITFNPENGKVIYDKNIKKFGITTKEIERLELDKNHLDLKLINKDRAKYLDYHKKNIYHKGI